MDERELRYHLQYRQQEYQRRGAQQRRLNAHPRKSWLHQFKSILRIGSRTVEKLQTAELIVLNQSEVEGQ